MVNPSGLSLIFSASFLADVSCLPRQHIHFAGGHFETRASVVRLSQEDGNGCA